MARTTGPPKVVIVDEFTGRLMPGRRWSDGLHQAVEAKENVKIQRENQTLATITFQNYFRMYKKLSGMTGTAETEAAEFQKIYNLDVTVVPTNRALIRKEYQDVVYRTEEEKFRNAAKEIKRLHETGQPVLVGTISVEKSEKLSGILKRMGVRHEVLNAKNHEREAVIVAQAGRKAAVTVSTNMAGRGTDILLGGNPEFMAKDACLKEKVAERLAEAEVKYVGDETFNYFSHHDQFYRVRRDKWDEIYARFKRRDRRRTRRGDRPWAACASWAPNATNPGASITSFAAAPDARAIPAARASSSPSRTTCCAFSAASACRTSCCAWAWKRTCPSNPSSSPSGSPRRRKPSKCRISRPANTCSNTTTSTTSSARPFTACAASCSKASTRKSASWIWCGASSSSISTCAAPTTSTPTLGTCPRCAPISSASSATRSISPSCPK